MNQPYVFGHRAPTGLTRAGDEAAGEDQRRGGCGDKASKRGSIKITAGLTRPALRMSMRRGASPALRSLKLNAMFFDSFAADRHRHRLRAELLVPRSIVYVPGGVP